MKYVLDSSVAVKWVLPEIDSDKATLLLQEYQKGLHELLAPDVFPVESGHAITRAERQKRIAVGTGWALWNSIMADAPVLIAYLPLMRRAFEISSNLRIGIYDCLYVTLAEREACGFVTADDRLVKNLQSTFPFIIALSSLP